MNFPLLPPLKLLSLCFCGLTFDSEQSECGTSFFLFLIQCLCFQTKNLLVFCIIFLLCLFLLVFFPLQSSMYPYFLPYNTGHWAEILTNVRQVMYYWATFQTSLFIFSFCSCWSYQFFKLMLTVLFPLSQGDPCIPGPLSPSCYLVFLGLRHDYLLFNS